jgi:hypothetical protein
MSYRNQVKARRAELQQQCAAEREQLTACVGEIEARLQRTDKLIGQATQVLNRPAVWVSGAAMLLALGHAGWWSRITRGLMLLASAKRLYSILKQ